MTLEAVSLMLSTDLTLSVGPEREGEKKVLSY